MLQEFVHRFEQKPSAVALIESTNESVSYGDLLRSINDWQSRLAESGVASGDVVLLKGDYGRSSISALFALLSRRAIVLMLAPTSYEKEHEFTEIGQPGWLLDADTSQLERMDDRRDHPLYELLRQSGQAGIVLFSSGSSGQPKGTVHSADRLLTKFSRAGKELRTLAFLLFDHIAGLDTLFYSLANTSTLVVPRDRTPKSVCEAIETHNVDVLPTAPSFLNVLSLTDVSTNYDLTSLKIVTYGSEMMSDSTLRRCGELFPAARLIQKYGTSEIGALPSKSRSNSSTWIKIGGAGYDWRERDGLLEIRANTAMIGYLNAPSPFTEDGYFMTGDRIETDGEYIRFLGRESDLINVGGQKVYPAEVENLIQKMPEVVEVAVHGEPHAILGSIVVATIYPTVPDTTSAKLRQLVRKALTGCVESYKIPQKVVVASETLTTSRYKIDRKQRA